MALQLKRMTGDLKDRENRLKHYYDATIDGQEIERERLSRELHDGLGQELIAMKLRLESAEGIADAKTQAVLDNMRNMLNGIIDEIRRISNDLMPSGLQQFGIVNAIRKLGSSISENTGINVIVEAGSLNRNPDNKTILYIYRIVQEALNNVVKHASAREIRISLDSDEQHIILQVSDNGKGFVFEKDQKYSGNGIYNMHERVSVLNGTINIDSRCGLGTRISIIIPFG
jgi:signal transduction histidine kinase